jgi:hypothetical protein
LGQISQNARGAAAVNAIVAAYRATVRQNPAQAAVLLRVANRRLNQFILPSQRGAIALSLSQATAAAFIQAGITAESPLYLQTFPFIATTIPSDQRTASLLNQIAQTASFANERVGGNSVADIPVTDAIFGSAGVTPPPVS